MTVRTRFAPSPTGYLHVGGARTALFCWLYARHCGGTFILRVEDTDRARSTAESVDAILDGLAWLGLDCDEGPFFQSERFERYAEVIERLLDEGKAYRCYCPKERLEALRAEQMARKDKPRYDGKCRHRTDPPPAGVAPVIRFENPPDGEVWVNDLVRGSVAFRNDELDDLIIARGDGTPTYNFTVVVDDMDMEITHVIRGDDHVNNTPRQINILAALGAAPPVYAHVPMILGPDGQRLSKRHGAVSVTQFRDDGFLPEALVNYLVRLGWSHGDQEIFTREEMIEHFDIADVNRAAAAFDLEKLLWLDQHYIKHAGPERIAGPLAAQLRARGYDLGAGPDPGRLYLAQRERAKTLAEMAANSDYFYRDFDEYDAAAAKKHLRPVVLEPMERLHRRLQDLSPWRAEEIHAAVVETAEQAGLGLGKLGQPLRVAVCGRGVSPPFDVTLELIGKERTLARLERALAFIRARAGLP